MTTVAPPIGGLLAGAVGDATETLQSHLRRFGRPPTDPWRTIEALERADLRGRGGAGFPTARKWRAVADHTSRGLPAVVIANGSEGEPCSSKDRLLLRIRPHLVLDGLRLAAEAVGATDTFVYVPQGDRDTLRVLSDAINERLQHLDGERRPTLVAAPPRYVGGQETALIARVEGKPARPSYTPPFPFAQGVWGRPTLVHNVETLARVALIARDLDSASLALVTISGAVVVGGVTEVVIGTPLGAVVQAAGGVTGPPFAVLAGGYFGCWLRAATCWGLGFGTDVPLGAGVLAVVDGGHCPIAETARIVTYLARESAGQCGPCVNALPAIADALTALTSARRARPRIDLLQHRSRELVGRGACRHPDGAALLVQSLLAAFEPEVGTHLRSGPCSACSAPALLPIPSSRGGWR
ncbi:MAG: NADH-ubiquinone oxidoreductase-F iron-sulfur binding region domain-containing protein [Candidatus Dormibacteria bacterium]